MILHPHRDVPPETTPRKVDTPYACSSACLFRCDAAAIEMALEACADQPVGEGTIDVVARDGSLLTLLRIPADIDDGFPRRTTVLMPDELWILDPSIWDLHFGLPGEASAQPTNHREIETERVLITGNTFPIREALKALGGRWDGDARGWRVLASKATEAKTLLAKAGPATRKPRRSWGRSRCSAKGGRSKRASALPAGEIYLFDSTAKVGDCVPSPTDPSVRVKVFSIEKRHVHTPGSAGWILKEIRIAKPMRAACRTLR